MYTPDPGLENPLTLPFGLRHCVGHHACACTGGGAGGEPGARQEERRINYVGPDADLAPALEAEMLDRSPGVK
jgi:hypothetical protein